MSIKEIVHTINNFNTSEATEDFELNLFFDDIGQQIFEYGRLNTHEKESLIQAFFQFLNRQPPELEENMSFVHLVEAIDHPDYPIYDEALLSINQTNPSLTSILLLNRFANLEDTAKWVKGTRLLRKIGENKEVSELIRNEAMDYFNYQRDKVK